MDLKPYIEKFRRRFAEVEASLSEPDAFANPQRGQELTREHARLPPGAAAGVTLQLIDLAQAMRGLADDLA